MIKPFPYERPLSWSQISSFRYNPHQWYTKYVLGEEQPTSLEMEFGKKCGELLASDPAYLPEVPRLSVFEYELKFTIHDIPMVGYIDSYEPHSAHIEYKTGRKAWNQKRVDDHGQIDLYLLGLYIIHAVKPETINSRLAWLPTHIKDGEVALVEPFKPVIFNANRTTADILRFGNYIKEVRKEMELYYHQQTHIHTTDFFAK